MVSFNRTDQRRSYHDDEAIMTMTSTLNEASRYFWVGMYWYMISQMPAQKVMKS